MPVHELDAAWSRRGLLTALAVAPFAARAEAPPETTVWADFGGFVGAEPDGFTLSNASVLDHHGRLQAGVGLRVEGGRIVELGPQVRGGEDMGGDWIVPGFTDACSHLGLFEIGAEKDSRDDHDTRAMTPDARAEDGYNPLAAPVAVTRVEGITHAVICPRLNRLVSGQAALVQTAGRTLQESVVRSPLALCVSMGRGGLEGEGGPGSRVGVGRALREWMEDAPSPRALTPREERRKKPAEADDLSPGDRVARSVRERQLKVLVAAERADDIERAVEWLRAYELDGVLLGCAEGWMVADLLADAALPVVLGPLMVQPDSFEHPGARYDNAAILHAHGVPLAFASRGNHHARGLRADAGVLVAHGLPHEAAIQALTVGAAEAFGLPGHGRMGQGGQATFFRASGDPLQPRTRIREVWIAGRKTRMRTRQSELYERYKVLR